MNILKHCRGLLRIRTLMLMGMMAVVVLPRLLSPITERVDRILFARDQGTILPSVFSILITVCVISFIWRQMGKTVVGPLEAMSAAARRIAGGDLDFELPRTSVLEVAEVRAALQALGDGLKE